MYLVGHGEAKLEDREFAIVEASHQGEAIREFVREVAIKEDLWLETIYDRAINMSFAENFWIQTQEDEARF